MALLQSKLTNQNPRHAREKCLPASIKGTQHCWPTSPNIVICCVRLHTLLNVVAAGTNNSQHCCPNNVGSCCVRLHVAYSFLIGWRRRARFHSQKQSEKIKAPGDFDVIVAALKLLKAAKLTLNAARTLMIKIVAHLWRRMNSNHQIVFTQIVHNFLFSFVTENLSLHVCPFIDWGKRSLKKTWIMQTLTESNKIRGCRMNRTIRGF